MQAPHRHAILSTILETLHNALYRPAQLTLRQSQLDIDLSVRVIVISQPLTALIPSNYLTGVRAQTKDSLAQSFGEKTASNGSPLFALFLKETIDLP